MHQIPTKPEALRVRTWRTLQRLGAASIKNSVYAMPNIPFSRKALTALAKEIEAGGGEAILCETDFVLGVNSAALIEQHNRLLKQTFRALEKDLSTIEREMGGKTQDLIGIEHALGRVRSLFKKACERNAFACDGQESCRAFLERVEGRISAKGTKAPKLAKVYKKATWVTRADVRVDRMASAWLIQRSIDPGAKFLFVNPRAYKPAASHLRFDMFEAEFTHEGELCTFEVLLKRFGLAHPELVRIGEIIHDLDIKDAKYEHPETSGVQVFLDGLAKRIADDSARIKEASSFFDSLVASFRSHS